MIVREEFIGEANLIFKDGKIKVSVHVVRDTDYPEPPTVVIEDIVTENTIRPDYIMKLQRALVNWINEEPMSFLKEEFSEDEIEMGHTLDSFIETYGS
jgi:hypothetical protein